MGLCFLFCLGTLSNIYLTWTFWKGEVVKYIYELLVFENILLVLLLNLVFKILSFTFRLLHCKFCYFISTSKLLTTTEIIVEKYSIGKNLWDKENGTEACANSYMVNIYFEVSVSLTSLNFYTH